MKPLQEDLLCLATATSRPCLITFMPPKGSKVMNDVLMRVHAPHAAKFNAPTAKTFRTIGRKAV